MLNCPLTLYQAKEKYIVLIFKYKEAQRSVCCCLLLLFFFFFVNMEICSYLNEILGNSTSLFQNFYIFVCINQIQMPIYAMKHAYTFHSCSLTFVSIQMVWYRIREVLCIKFWLQLGCCFNFRFANVQKILAQWFYTKNMHNGAEHPADCV